MEKKTSLASRLDALFEFDREPVSENKLEGAGKFIGLFAGEHVAATEFVIGAMFVIHGVSAKDLFLGLIFGNLLAVLSWAFIVAPIAVRTRLTLYWYLRKVAGPGVTIIYNIINAFLYCVLAGAMISVSASAVGLAFKVPTPALTDILPNSLGWVLITLFVGGVVTLFAILGFDKVSKFSSVCSPWMFAIFIAGALALLPGLNMGEPIKSLGEFWHVAETKIWTGIPVKDAEKYNMWHIMFFAWLANLAMHIGLSDMATLRYAKNWKYGFFSAFGMYPGHFLAWICSGIMLAAYVARLGGAVESVSTGDMAYMAAGFAGAVAVVIAGWTTSNPTMYRAGLALQVVTPNWARWKVTLVAGLVTSIVACFPLVFNQLLNFVAIYGLILMPIGAVVFAEHWLIPKLGLPQYRAECKKMFINWSALITWVATLAIVFFLPLHMFFKWLPGYFLAIIMYLGLSLITTPKKA